MDTEQKPQTQQPQGLAALFYEIATRQVYMQYCDGQCQTKTQHTCKDEGLDERYTCTVCGAQHTVRVR